MDMKIREAAQMRQMAQSGNDDDDHTAGGIFSLASVDESFYDEKLEQIYGNVAKDIRNVKRQPLKTSSPKAKSPRSATPRSAVTNTARSTPSSVIINPNKSAEATAKKPKGLKRLFRGMCGGKRS